MANGDRQHRTIIDTTRGKPAQTSFVILVAFENHIYLVQAFSVSGYTHQIRAHFTSLNGAILCDRLYHPHPYPPASAQLFDTTPVNAWVAHNLSIRRPALHAYQISFTHLENNEKMTIRAPYPPDFETSFQILKIRGQA